MLHALPADIRYYIATFSETAWQAAFRYDNELYLILRTESARQQFIRRFTVRFVSNLSTTYRVFGKAHRENDLPAIIYADGGAIWCCGGKIHRSDDRPAVVTRDYEKWYADNQLHRIGGPAFISGDGRREWYRRGIMYLGPTVQINYKHINMFHPIMF